jgi:hypothetical protein
MMQTFTGLECELRRRNYNVSSSMERFPSYLNETRWRYRVRALYQMTVWQDDNEYSVTVRFFNMYRPNTAILHQILSESPVDIVMFDHGLHYLTDAEQHILANESLPYLKLLSERVPLVLWRETSAQHYATHGGHYRFGLPLENASCVPIPPLDVSTSVVTNTMNALLRQLDMTLVNAGEADFFQKAPQANELVFLPFRLYTMPLWNVHAGSPDCTHFCSTPYLWLPIWRTLRIALDRHVLAR